MANTKTSTQGEVTTHEKKSPAMFWQCIGIAAAIAAMTYPVLVIGIAQAKIETRADVMEAMLADFAQRLTDLEKQPERNEEILQELIQRLDVLEGVENDAGQNDHANPKHGALASSFGATLTSGCCFLCGFLLRRRQWQPSL